jgi:hypothetical protein
MHQGTDVWEFLAAWAVWHALEAPQKNSKPQTLNPKTETLNPNLGQLELYNTRWKRLQHRLRTVYESYAAQVLHIRVDALYMRICALKALMYVICPYVCYMVYVICIFMRFIRYMYVYTLICMSYVHVYVACLLHRWWWRFWLMATSSSIANRIHVLHVYAHLYAYMRFIRVCVCYMYATQVVVVFLSTSNFCINCYQCTRICAPIRVYALYTRMCMLYVCYIGGGGALDYEQLLHQLLFLRAPPWRRI